MNLSLIATAPLPVQVHLATIVPAFVLGTWMIFASRKGSPTHRTVGRIYLLLMSITAVAATFIREPSMAGIDFGPLRIGPIHIFVVVTAWSVYTALTGIRRGNIKSHRGAMLGLYFGGLVLAGLIAFLPQRMMWRMFFG
jgi:uncharacterized membrane protein